MKSWYKQSHDIELKDGSKVREHRLIFETTDAVLAKQIEKYFQFLMDTDVPRRERSWHKDNIDTVLDETTQSHGDSARLYAIANAVRYILEWIDRRETKWKLK